MNFSRMSIHEILEPASFVSLPSRRPTVHFPTRPFHSLYRKNNAVFLPLTPLRQAETSVNTSRLHATDFPDRHLRSTPGLPTVRESPIRESQTALAGGTLLDAEVPICES